MDVSAPQSSKLWIKNFIHHSNPEAASVFTSLIYGIWNSRNKLVFESKDTPLHEVVAKVMNQVLQFLDAQKIRTGSPSPATALRSSSWTPPSMGSFKLNTDATKLDAWMWGAAAVVRDSNGIVLGAVTWHVKCGPDPKLAEALSLRQGLHFALDMGFLTLEAESDCQTLINELSSPTKGTSSFNLIVAD